jgi:hypothetical protein
MLFRFPERPWETPPSFFQGYFEYGRSIEGKLDKLKRRASLQSTPILGYGWLENKRYERLPKKNKDDQVLVAVYGMSHAKALGDAITEVNSKYVIRSITGPGVPPGWSFAAYEADKNLHEAKVVILGIMTDNIAYISATSGSTSYFDLSHPYTFPRYYVENDKLKEIFPPFYTEKGFKEYFFDGEKWAEYKIWLKNHDKFYNSYLFNSSIADISAILRVVRRAYAQKHKERLFNTVYTTLGFNQDCEEVLALKKIIEIFASSVRERRATPILYIVNNEGRGDHLFRVLKPTIDLYDIPYLSTHIICPPDNPRVFKQGDSHFTEAKDEELASEMIKIIENQLSRSIKKINLN